jgi:hypothetical protein
MKFNTQKLTEFGISTGTATAVAMGIAQVGVRIFGMANPVAMAITSVVMNGATILVDRGLRNNIFRK